MSNGYDLSASQFSPEGRVFQVEYAAKAVERSGTSIGLRGGDGVVLAVEKLVNSPLFENDSGRRIFTVDTNIGMAVAGLTADGYALADIARQEAANHRQQFGSPITVNHMCERISAYMHAYTLFGSARPFGVSITLGGWDEIFGAQLFKIEPSGKSFGYFACASGKGEQQAKTEMEKYKFVDMPLENLVQSAGRIIQLAHNEAKDKGFCFEMGLVGKDTAGLHCINPEPWLSLAVQAGLEALHEEDEDSDD
ncbi:proteasome subunit alpha type-3-like [Scaptodrosophila lebanonensis]|uniref:Proteasome subunit alpha type n=1 Tax=Drosophila lebanonensis TaxID=7225 RepID=A0A6J2U994_DROLE|nr:proteasome subunit alpha type-3-like [Scaptodrosophila lebanonensis]